ncbi:uncharacterized protein LOC34621648 [Cyclospora cayetanensis]|uniref:Uncharacterized protein LOC34621648 n=1 Tax=Cyclospora cayetanensis TaxID=88456 RepID=A0A6P6RVC7_9EIME|nr:uncharacterized protein LOC34621648 [Cyclospora cayetanensis]
MLHPRASASETGNRDAVSESPRSASHRRISAPAAAATSAALPETVSLQQLQQLQQDVWAAEAEAKQRVLKLLKEGEAQFHELQSSLQQQQQQSHQASVHVLQLQQKLVGNGSRGDSLACRLQKSENQQLLLRQQLSVIQEVEGFVLQLQLAQKQLAFFRELLKKQLLVEAAASLQIFAHALLLPLLAATRDTKPLPAIRELQQQFIEVHKQLVLSLDSRLRQHLQVSSQQITLTPVLHCSSISRSPDAAAGNFHADSRGVAAMDCSELAAAAEATAGEISSGSGNACGTVSRLTDVWKSLHHLGLLHRRLYFITQQINKCVLQPSFTWKWTADREKAFDSEGTASLLQYICDFAAEEHVECRRMWGKILWNFLEQPLLELLLHSRTEHFLLRAEAAAADAVAGGVLPFYPAAAAATVSMQIEQLFQKQGLVSPQDPQQQQPHTSRATRRATEWLAKVYVHRNANLLAEARQLLLQALAGSASTASAAVLATDASIPGGMHDILMVQQLTNQEQQTQRLQLLQCIAEETDIALVLLAPLRITKETWLLLQLLQSLLRHAARTVANCCHSSSNDLSLPCWCSIMRDQPCLCSSSSCCSSRIAARAELATALSICNLFLMLRFLDSHAAAAITAAPGVDMSAPALRWTDAEVVCRWLLRMPLMLAVHAATTASRGAPLYSASSCSCSNSSSSCCCSCQAAAARRTYSLLSDSLPIFDGYPDASMAAACGVSTAARDPATTAKQQQAEVPFRQQIAELVVALKQQQETIFVNMLKGLQKELQTASNELHELLKTATRSSTRLETHLEAAAGILTQRLNNAALDLLPILPIQVYAEVVGLAADCLIDCVLRTVLSAALAAVPGVYTPEAAASAAGSNSSRAVAQRLGPLCCRLLQHVCSQVRTTMSLHLSSRQQLRPEAAAQADAASASDWSVVLQRLAGGEDRGIAADVSAQRQQDEKQGAQCATAHASVRVEQFSSLLRVAVALQQVLEADVLLLLQHAATHAALLRQTFRPVEHRLALIALNPFIGAAPLGARREVFLSVAAVGNVHLSDCVVPSGG